LLIFQAGIIAMRIFPGARGSWKIGGRRKASGRGGASWDDVTVSFAPAGKVVPVYRAEGNW